MKFGPTRLSSSYIRRNWSAILNSPAYPTATAAIQAILQPGYNSLVIRFTQWPVPISPSEDNDTDAFHMALNVSYAQGVDIVQGLDMHKLGCFASVSCCCKSKSHVVTNFALRPLALSFTERAGYGVHAITASAPALGLAIFGRFHLDGNGDWSDSLLYLSLSDYKPAPFKKYQLRLKNFGAPTLSIMARSTCFNTYILSVMPYTVSYFGICSSDLNLLRQQAARFVIGRHWIESEMLPYVLRYLGVSVMLDPALSATVAATGLYFRSGNSYEDLWANDHEQMSSNQRQKSVALDLLQLWVPFIPLRDIANALANPSNGVPGRLAKLKATILAGMQNVARTYLEKKIVREGWSRGISGVWVHLVAKCSKKWCNGIARYTLLRWAVNQDDDVWLALRGTRHQQLCQVCGLPADTFPEWCSGAPFL